MVEPPHRIVRVHRRGRGEDEVEHLIGVGDDEISAVLIEPPTNHRAGSLRIDDVHPSVQCPPDDRGRLLRVATGGGLLKRCNGVTAGFQRGRRSLVRITPARPAERAQTRSEERSEQVVVPVPAVADIEADDEQVVRHQSVEQLCRVGVSRDLLAQRGVELLEHRGGVEELDEVAVEGVQDLVDEELCDGSIG